MPGPQRRKKFHRGDTHLRKGWRLRRRTKDLDQIDEDLQSRANQLLNEAVDIDRAGFAQHYCIHCSRDFIDTGALEAHFRTKVHKRRLKALEDEPYTVAESERAAGMGNFVPVKSRPMHTLRRSDTLTPPDTSTMTSQTESADSR